MTVLFFVALLAASVSEAQTIDCKIIVGEERVICECESQTPPPTCTHDECTVGAKLDPTCTECVATICACDPYCCTTSWDAICIVEAQAICNLPCGVTGTCQVCECPPE